MNLRRIGKKHFIFCIILLFILDYCGVFLHLFESNFESSFQYPIEGNVLKYAKQMRQNQSPDIAPINLYNYDFIRNPREKCKLNDKFTSPKLVFLVKSALRNFKQRDTIRKTWGFEKRFSDIEIRTVFLLGIPAIVDDEFSDTLKLEIQNFNDIVQSNFIDTYYNNTIKTMRAFQWAAEFCPQANFYAFIDDDFYVSTKNILRFIRDPVNYPFYLDETEAIMKKIQNTLNAGNHTENDKKLIKEILSGQIVHTIDSKNQLEKIKQSEKLKELIFPKRRMRDLNLKRKKRDIFERELPSGARLFSGHVIIAAPHRHKFSKWYVDLNEYKWHIWPKYVTAGAYILSREALLDMYYVSKFTKHFRFDDIFLGIVAQKALIDPLHNKEFHFHKLQYSGPESYKYVLASHGYEDSKELLEVWSNTRAAGHA